jgi:hypothetical protein
MSNSPSANELWDELRLLHSTIDRLDNFSFRIKNWFLAIFIASTGIAISSSATALIIFNFVIITVFYLYEVMYRITHDDFIERFREVQKILRGEIELNETNKSPNMDKYLRIEKERARRPIRDLHIIMELSIQYLFQLRMSLPYLAAIVSNVIILLIL